MKQWKIGTLKSSENTSLKDGAIAIEYPIKYERNEMRGIKLTLEQKKTLRARIRRIIKDFLKGGNSMKLIDFLNNCILVRVMDRIFNAIIRYICG